MVLILFKAVFQDPMNCCIALLKVSLSKMAAEGRDLFAIQVVEICRGVESFSKT